MLRRGHRIRRRERLPPPARTRSQGRGLARAIRRALDDARVSAADICYVAAHGSATRAGDLSETLALRQALGSAAAVVPASSVKPQTGHLVGAAGALNVAAAALAITHGTLPATLNLDHPDPRCDLDYVARQARPARVTRAIALARGIEGQAAALVLERPS